jgi:DNA-binding response OmpR family regulator
VILVVDDNDLAARLTRDVLRSVGREAWYANTAAEARDCLRSRPQGYACAVVDQLLPDGTGLDVVRWCREAGLEVPVLLLTGQVREAAEEIRRAVIGEQLGPCWVKQKPVDPGELVRLVAVLAGGAGDEPTTTEDA